MNLNDIQTSNPDTGFLPVSEEDYALFGLEARDSSFISPLNQELVFTDEYMVFDDHGNVISNGLDFGDGEIARDFSAKSFEPQDENGNLNAIPAIDKLEIVGGFGDYDGGNDTTLEIKEGETVIETFSMIGDGFATLYRDDESKYIFFSDTDENTKVEINALSNLEFEDFNGEALSIVTRGSIKAENITLVEDDDPDTDSGLNLRAGVGGSNLDNAVFESYGLVDFFDREMVDINYTGQIVGNDSYSGVEQFFFYDGQYVYNLPGYESSRAFGINDNLQMIGEGVSSTSDDPHIPFVVYSNGAVEEFQSEEDENGRYTAPPGSNALAFSALGSVRDINNFLETAYYQLNTPPDNTPPEYELTPFEDAHFLSPNGTDSVNIGYELLNSDDSRAFGINNSGDVVGINRETDRAFVFNRENNSVTNLGTLAGSDDSAAYAINDEGQIVGTSGNQAFLYEDGVMKDMGVSYVGNPTARDGIDINNLGQAVVTSAEGVPFIYEDDVLTDINSLLASANNADAGYVITEAKGINDRGQIIAQGTFNGNARGFLLNPSFTPNDTVTVGNISTFGESVILQGDKVYLNGQTVDTEGGRVLVSGDTTVNDNLAINTSVSDVDKGEVIGGNIVFLNALDSNESGEQSLTVKAASGNLTFTKAVGESSPLFDLTVEGAGSLTANADITVENELNFDVIDGVTTANVISGGLASIKTGQIGEDIFDSTGNVATGDIEALSLQVGSNGSFTAENITTSDGDLSVISLDDISTGQLAATNGIVDLISGNAGINIGGAANANRSFFASAQLDVNTKEITSNQNAVILNSTQGAVTVEGSVSASGEVSLASANDVTVNTVSSLKDSVSLLSATGVINSKGAIVGEEDINLASSKDLIVTQSLRAKSGTTSLISLGGSVTSNVAINSGFNTYIAGKKDVKTLGIRNGGNVHVESELGKVDVSGNVISGGGDVNILGFRKVSVGNIVSKSGDANVVSSIDSIKTGYIKTDYFARAGDVYLDALRNVKVAGKININDIDFSIYTGEEDSATITIVHNHLSRKATETNSFMVGDISRNGSLAFTGNLEDFITPTAPTTPITSPTSTKTFPKGLHLEIYIRVFDAILFLDTAPAHQAEINPISGGRYLSEEEFNIIGQLTDEQTETLKGIWNTKDPKYAPYIPREEEDERKYAIDTRRGCFSLELKGHLGDNPEYSSGIDPDIIEAARDYATRLTGSDNDYLVITRFGTAAFYDGLVNPTGTANRFITDIPNRPQKVIEAKYGYNFLRKLIDKEEELPVGFVRDPNLIRDSKEATAKEKNIFRKMITELNGEALVAEACLLNYAAIFSNNNAGRSAKELFTYSETKKTNFSIKTHFISPSLR